MSSLFRKSQLSDIYNNCQVVFVKYVYMCKTNNNIIVHHYPSFNAINIFTFKNMLEVA